MSKTAFIFSGQGAQFPGMMKSLYDNVPASRAVFEVADKTLGRSISELCFYGMQEELNLTHNTQPCVLAADIAAYAAVKERGIHPSAVAGFSLGEYAALYAAGVYELDALFKMIQLRADYMQEAVPVGQGGMAAVLGLDALQVQKMCQSVEGYVVPANYNCPGQIVISGELSAVEQVVAEARKEKIKAMVLPVSAPFHCEMLKGAADKLKAVLEKETPKSPNCPVYMNVDALPAKAEEITEKLYLQTISPVLWEATLRNMQKAGIDTFIELGPGNTLTGFVKKVFKGIDGVCWKHVSDMDTLSEV